MRQGRKELGDVNKSDVEGASGKVEGWTQWLPGTVPTVDSIKQWALQKNNFGAKQQQLRQQNDQ